MHAKGDGLHDTSKEAQREEQIRTNKEMTTEVYKEERFEKQPRTDLTRQDIRVVEQV